MKFSFAILVLSFNYGCLGIYKLGMLIPVIFLYKSRAYTSVIPEI